MPISALPPLAKIDVSNSTADANSSSVNSQNADSFAQAMNSASRHQEKDHDAVKSDEKHGREDTTEHGPSQTKSKTPEKSTDKTDKNKTDKKSDEQTTDKPSDTTDDSAAQTPVSQTPAAAAPAVAVVATPVLPADLLPTPVPVAAQATTTVAAAVVAEIANAAVAAQANATTTNPAGPTLPTSAVTAAPADKTSVDATAVPTAVLATPTTEAPTATTVPDQNTFSQALSQTVTEQVSTEVAKLAQTTKSPAEVAAQALAGHKAAAELASSLATNAASTNMAVTGSKDVVAPAPAAPLTQLVQVMTPLRLQRDGNYELTLQLHPADMGKIQVSVTLHQGEISMQLSADNPSSRQMLRDSMNDLRQQLQDSGLSTGSLDVSTGDGGQQQFQSSTNANQHIDTTDDESDSEFFSRLATVMTNSSAPSDGSLDVRV